MNGVPRTGSTGFQLRLLCQRFLMPQELCKHYLDPDLNVDVTCHMPFATQVHYDCDKSCWHSDTAIFAI